MNRKPTCSGRHLATENHLLASTPNSDKLIEGLSRIRRKEEDRFGWIRAGRISDAIKNTDA